MARPALRVVRICGYVAIMFYLRCYFRHEMTLGVKSPRERNNEQMGEAGVKIY